MAKERNARTTRRKTKKTAKKATGKSRRTASKGRLKDSPVDLDTLKEFLALMESHQLSEFEIEHEDFHVRFCKGGSGESLAGVRVIPQPALPAESIPKTEPAAATQTPSDQEGTIQVKSPMVGTLYRASAPDAEPFVSVGDQVHEDTVVCIIEAMKVMNEIKAEVDGEVVAFLVENGEPVEFGQPIMLVRPSGGSA